MAIKELTPSENSRLSSYLKSSVSTTGRKKLRKVLSDGYIISMRDMSEPDLRYLRDSLPSGSFDRITKRDLYRVRKKLSKAIYYKINPFMDPYLWPKVYREFGHRNKNLGLHHTKSGAVIKIHPLVTPMNLNSTHIWNHALFGPLSIMGYPFEISNLIAKSPRFVADCTGLRHFDAMWKEQLDWGEMSKREYDRLTRTNLYVTAAFDSFVPQEGPPGAVVLDVRKEMGGLFGKSIGKVVAAGIPVPEVSGANIVDGMLKGRELVQTGFEMREKMEDPSLDDIDREYISKRDRITITIDIAPHSEFGHKSRGKKGIEVLDRKLLAERSREAIRMLYGK